MTTRTALYVKGIRAALGAVGAVPARLESSPVRAATRDAIPMLRVLPGREVVVSGSIGCTARHREVHLWLHTAGDDHLDLAERVFEAAHPIVMAFQASGLVSVEEVGTDEPKYADADLTRQVVVKRYLFIYQTDEHSLSE